MPAGQRREGSPTPRVTAFDVAIVGAGAAGLFCAALAGQRGASVVLIDHAAKVAEKIRISGGGRCNFTNAEVDPSHFISGNPDFCRSALARYTPHDFTGLVEKHGIAWHEKHKGQRFCDGSSTQIIEMLLAECTDGGVSRLQPCSVDGVTRTSAGFALATSRGPIQASRLVVATGGLSIPAIGASDWGYRIAKQFGHSLVATRPGLVPLVFAAEAWQRFSGLAGLSLPVRIAVGQRRRRIEFAEDLLFTHRGLSGPAVLQISSHWQPPEPVIIDLSDGSDLEAAMLAGKQSSSRSVSAVLREAVPRRLADTWLDTLPALGERRLADCRDRDLGQLCSSLREWRVDPVGSEGYRKAEVTVGGVDTREVDSRSMQSRKVAGLHFIGEVLDVTGWLGGYNFQWAWASAAACARGFELAP